MEVSNLVMIDYSRLELPEKRRIVSMIKCARAIHPLSLSFVSKPDEKTTIIYGAHLFDSCHLGYSEQASSDVVGSESGETRSGTVLSWAKSRDVHCQRMLRQTH